MIVYISPAGKTAAMIDDFLSKPRELFNFDVAILLSSLDNAQAVRTKCQNYNSAIVEVHNPYYGNVDFEPALKRLLMAFYMFVSDDVERVVVNGSGGTEKMSSIIKSAVDALRLDGYDVTHVFGVYNPGTKEVIFTEFPVLGLLDIVEAAKSAVSYTKVKKEVDIAKTLDEYESTD